MQHTESPDESNEWNDEAMDEYGNTDQYGREGKTYNPYAVCTNSVGKQHTKKWKDCVKDVKKDQGED